jgi:hypothetical protein
MEGNGSKIEAFSRGEFSFLHTCEVDVVAGMERTQEEHRKRRNSYVLCGCP